MVNSGATGITMHLKVRAGPTYTEYCYSPFKPFAFECKATLYKLQLLHLGQDIYTVCMYTLTTVYDLYNLMKIIQQPCCKFCFTRVETGWTSPEKHHHTHVSFHNNKWLVITDHILNILNTMKTKQKVHFTDNTIAFIAALLLLLSSTRISKHLKNDK